MKNTSLVLTLLCTSLVWGSAPNAMEELVLDRKVGEDGRNKILVLTPSGQAKALAKQEFYDQLNNQRNISSSEPPKSESSKSADDDKALELSRSLGIPLDELKLAKSLHLSFEEQPLETNPSQDPLETKSQVLKPSGLSLPFVKQEDDSELNTALLESVREEEESQLKRVLLESIQEHEAHKRKLAEERRKAEERRDETRRALEEVRDIRSAQRQSLFSRIKELEAERTIFTQQLLDPTNDLITITEKESYKKWLEEKLEKVRNTMSPLHDEILAFNSLDHQIHEEIMHLIQGGDPRDLPWIQEVLGTGSSRSLHGGTTPSFL